MRESFTTPCVSETPSEVWDVAVIGAGPAGLAAATTAAEHGHRTVLVDDNPAGGGQIWRQGDAPSLPRRARHWLRRARLAGVTHLAGATVFDAGLRSPFELRTFDPDEVGSRLLRARRLILCTGARELFLPFPGWQLPGVFGLGGLQALVKDGLDVRGKRVLLAGSGPLLLAVAASLRRRGARIVGLVEQAPVGRLAAFAARLAAKPAKLRQLLTLETSLLGLRRRFDAWPVEAFGDDRVREVAVRHSRGSQSRIPCDLFGCAFGLVPDTALARLLGCGLDRATRPRRVTVDEFQETSRRGVFCAGESSGVGGVDLALLEGQVAGLAAADSRELAYRLLPRRDRERRFAEALHETFEPRPELEGLASENTVVCRCEDVPLGRLRGYRDSRDAKLATRCGMGPCQGKVCGPALERLFDWQPRVRSPLVPVPLTALADSTLVSPASSRYQSGDPRI